MNQDYFSKLSLRVGGKGADAWEVHREGERRKARGDDILILSIGEDTQAATPQFIVDEAVAALQSADHHYSDLRGIAPLREAIVNRHRSVTARQADAMQCVVFSGAQNALFAASIMLLEAGDEVIIIEPYYSTYPATFTAGGAKPIYVQAKVENNYQPRLSDIEKVISDRSKVVVINSPNNPTGAIYASAFLRALVVLCEQHDLWLISDEVYAEFIFAGAHVSPAKFAPVESKCVVISSVSKSHAMTGWRIGWVIGPRALCDRLETLQLCMSYGLPPFIQAAAAVAIERGLDTTAAMVADYAGRARLVVDNLSRVSNLGVTAPCSGMFVILDISRVAADGREFAFRLLDEHGVCLLPCTGFGDNMTHAVRMSLCAPRDDLQRACDAIAQTASSTTDSESTRHG